MTETVLLLAWLVLAHLAADFVLQTGPIVRAKTCHLTGLDLDGNELSVEADELLARMFQHECDHLDGVLLLERLTKQQRKDAMREMRRREEQA